MILFGYIAALAIMFLIATFVWSCIVLSNFGTGLKTHCEVLSTFSLHSNWLATSITRQGRANADISTRVDISNRPFATWNGLLSKQETQAHVSWLRDSKDLFQISVLSWTCIISLKPVPCVGYVRDWFLSTLMFACVVVLVSNCHYLPNVVFPFPTSWL